MAKVNPFTSLYEIQILFAVLLVLLFLLFLIIKLLWAEHKEGKRIKTDRMKQKRSELLMVIQGVLLTRV